MKKTMKFAALVIAAISMVFAGCDPKPVTVEGGEALIKTIKIANGGLSGGVSYTGTVDNTAFTVTFDNVAAETNIAAIKFEASLSLGAKLSAATYDFSDASADATQLVSTIQVINDLGTVTQDYQVIINLAAPTSAPIIEKLIMKDENGTEYKATDFDGILCLGMPDAASAELVEIVLSPARATYEFTAMDGGKISASNPGMLELDFMGLTKEYELSFAAGPTPGADFSNAVVHDFSVRTGNAYADFAGELTRGSDFDGNYVLLANRTAPKLFAVADLLNDNVSNPILLDMSNVEGGTHVVSSGRLAQGHIYLCNLAVSISTEEEGEKLKVYHYSSPTAKPDVVLTWDGTGITNAEEPYAGRLGDNISVNLDESGNGYAYFAKQEPGDKIYRFTVTNFTNFSDPYEIALESVCSYYGFYNQVGANEYLFTSSYVPGLWLNDANGNTLKYIEFDWTENDARPNHGVDPRIITFNRARYLLFTVANSQGMHWNFGPVMYLFDITEGYDNTAALVKLEEAMESETFEPTYEYFLDTEGVTTASACSAQCNAAIVDGKLLIYTAAVNAGFALIELPKAQ